MFKQKSEELNLINGSGLVSPSRRKFLMYAGAAVVTSSVVMAGCNKDDDDDIDADTVDLGSGDTGILNYAYALEQLEAAFYAKVVAEEYSGMTASERQILNDIEKHERAHAEFFKAALGSNAIVALQVDFSSINFSNRASVLGAAKTFEDLGVSAYNGAGKLLVSADFLTLAGKIVSVEARHAAAIRSMLDSDPKSFAGDDVVDANGLDVVRTPPQVLDLAKTYLKTKVSGNNLPS